MRKILTLTLFILTTTFFAACEQSNTAQNNLTEPVNSDKNVKTDRKAEPSADERHIKVKSENSFDETYSALKKAIESKEPLTIVAELDHQANAKKAGMEIRPTKVIMFGNPKLGTPLMKANQAIGVDLPQKMLVYEDDKGDVFVVYNDPKILAGNHLIKGQDEVLDKISGALKGLSEAVSTKKGDK